MVSPKDDFKKSCCCDNSNDFWLYNSCVIVPSFSCLSRFASSFVLSKYFCVNHQTLVSVIHNWVARSAFAVFNSSICFLLSHPAFVKSSIFF